MASSRMPRWLWFLLVPVALVLVAWGALAVLFPPVKVRAIVSERVSRSLAREVRFADAGLTLFPPVRLVVREPEIGEPDGLASGVAFRARALNLDLDLLALLGRKFVVRDLTIDGPALHLLLRADGTTNWDHLGAKPEPGPAQPAMDLEIRHFAIRDGGLLIDDLAANRRTTFDLATSLSLATQQGGQRIATSGTSEISRLAFGPLSAARRADLNTGLEKLVWRIEHKGAFDQPTARLALERVVLKLGGTELAASGLVELPRPGAGGAAAGPRFDLRAQGTQLDLAELLRWGSVADAHAVQGLSGRGRVDFDLALRSASDPQAPLPAITGTLTLRDGAFRYTGAAADVQGVSFRAQFAPGQVSIPDLRATVAGQPLTGRFAASRFADPLVDFAVRGNVDLGAVYPMVAQPGVTLSGHAAVDVSGRGRAKDPGSLVLDGKAALAGVRVTTPDLPKPVEQVSGVIQFSPTRATVTGLTAHAGQSSFTLDAGVTRPLALLAKPGTVAPAGVTFTFRSPHLDVAEVLPASQGDPALPNARGSGQVQITELRQGRITLANVAASVGLEPGVLTSEHFSAKVYDGAISGSARFDLRDAAKPVYQVKTDVQAVDANALLSAWTPANGLLHGTLSTSLDFSGAGSRPEQVKRTLTLIALAAMNEGTLGPGPTLDAVSKFIQIPQLKELHFKDAKMPLRIESGRVITNPIRLSGANGDWLLAGSVGFDGSLDYAVSATLPPAAVAALQAKSALAAGALADEQGRVLLDFRVTGPWRAPRVAWDPSAMKDRLAGRASAAIEEQRAKLENEARALAESRTRAAEDSLRAAADRSKQAAEDSLRRKASGALQGFFGSLGKGKGSTTPAPAPPTHAPADTTAADTTQG